MVTTANTAVERDYLLRRHLDAIKALRALAPVEYVRSYVDAIPLGWIRKVLAAFQVESAFLWAYTAYGHGVVRLGVHGDGSMWRNIEPLAANANAPSNNQLALLRVESQPGSRKKAYKVFKLGVLGVYRSFPFSEDDRRTLIEILSYGADWVYYVLEKSFARHLDNAKHGISEYASSRDRPGTATSRVLGKVRAATKAYAAFFAVVDEDAIYIEYAHKPHYKTPVCIVSPTRSSFPLDLRERCLELKPFVWLDFDGRSGQLNVALKPHLPNEQDNWIYLIAPIATEGELICLMILQYRRRQPIFDIPVREFLNHCATALSFQAVCLFQRRINKMIIDPIYKSRETKVVLGQVFVLMPFTEAWSDRIWTKLIRPLVNGESLKAMRADDLFGRDVMEDVWKGILQSQIVIAEITGRNANVFYELGIAHTLGKPVILLTQRKEDIPFDLNRYRHIIYEDNLDGYEVLRNQLRASIRDILRV